MTLIFLVLSAFANAGEPAMRNSSGEPVEPTPVVSRVSRVTEQREPPQTVCRTGAPSAAEVHNRAKQIRATVQQLPDNSQLNCSGYVVTRIGSMVETMRPSGAELIRSYRGNIDGVGPDVCMSVTQGQDELVKRLDACSGVTPPPLATSVVERRTP